MAERLKLKTPALDGIFRPRPPCHDCLRALELFIRHSQLAHYSHAGLNHTHILNEDR